MRAFLWRAGARFRRSLASVADDHPLRRGYRLVRRLPRVSEVWRATVGTAALSLIEPEKYAARGRFASHGDVSAPVTTGPKSGLFETIFERAAKYEIPIEAIPGRVVVVNCSLSAGGAERQVVNTLLGLKARGIDVALVAENLFRQSGLAFHIETVTAANIDVEALPRQTEPGPHLYAQISRPLAEALCRLPQDILFESLDMVCTLRERRPEVVHLWQDQTAVKHGMAAVIAGVPRIVISLRNVNPTHFEYNADWLKPGFLALAKREEVIFSVNSKAGLESYAQWLGLPVSRFVEVRNGVRFPDTTPLRESIADIRERFGAGDGPLVGGIFRLNAEKRPTLWLEAARQVHDFRPNARFVIAGSGPLHGDLLDLRRRLGLDDVLHFAGEIRDVPAFLEALDLFVLTSKYEGTPNVLLEAQWHGRPVVTTHAGGAAETILPGQTGLLCEADTPAGVAKAVLEALGDPQLAQRARQTGPGQVAARYSWDAMIDQTLELYCLRS